MKNHAFLAYCLATPWAMMPEVMQHQAQLLLRGYQVRDGLLAAASLPTTPDAAAPEAAAARPAAPRQGAIAVVPIYGTIVQRASQLGPCDGGTSTQQISAALRQAMADDTVSQILLDIDSPGGSVFGVGELADEIRSARAQKPIIAIANSMAASAAYWLGCAASEFYMTPGGQVGSIGVWMAHEDISKALADAGITVTLISAGKYKVEGNPYGPLGEDAAAFQQSSVDAYYQAFTQAVAKGRGVAVSDVRAGMGQGRVLGASAALADKMVDGVATFDQVVKQMQRNARATAKPAGRSLASAQREIDIASL